MTFINHEIKPHQLTEALLGRYISLATFYTPHDNVFYLLQYLIPLLLTDLLNKPPHLPYALFNRLLLVLLLDLVVREVNEPILNVVQGVVVHAKPQIALVVEVYFGRVVVLD